MGYASHMLNDSKYVLGRVPEMPDISELHTRCSLSSAMLRDLTWSNRPRKESRAYHQLDLIPDSFAFSPDCDSTAT